MVGILANISMIFADENISVFTVSTFNTNYFLMKKDDEMRALSKLARDGYKILTGDAYGDYFSNHSLKDIMVEYSVQHDEWERIELKNKSRE